MRVCMFVWNNFTNDSRVLREATSLAKHHRVTVVATAAKGLPRRESVGQVQVIRVPLLANPLSSLLAGFAYMGFRIVGPRMLWKRILIKLGQERLQEVRGPGWLRRGLKRVLALAYGVASIARAASLRGCKAIFGSAFWQRWGSLQFVVRPLRPMKGVLKRVRYRVRIFARRIARTLERYFHLSRRSLMVVMGDIHTMFTRLVKWVLRPYALWLRTNAFLLPAASVGVALEADVYHAHDFDTLEAAVVCAKLLRGRLVYDSHELYAERNLPDYMDQEHERRAVMRVERRLIQAADLVITVNDHIAGELAERYGISKPRVVMNAPELSKLKIFSKEGADQVRLPAGLTAPILIYAGRLTFNRGLEQCVEALRFLPQASFVALGPDPYEYASRLQRIALDLGVASRVFTLPPVHPHQVASVCAQAHVGVALIQNTSLSYYLSLPTKLFEYIAAGIPVVASDFPAMRQVVEKDRIGVVCDPADPEAIAASIRQLTEVPKVHASYVTNVKRAARVKYYWASQEKILLEAYAEID